MMSALYRCVMFKRFTNFKKQAVLIPVVRFGSNAPPPQAKTRNSLLRVGNTGTGRTTASPSNVTMAVNKSKKVGFSCSRCFSSSPKDETARVKRVSIEGNIGTYEYIDSFGIKLIISMCQAMIVGNNVMWHHVRSNISCWKVDFCKTPSVSLSRLGGDGRTCQQVAEHWEWILEGCAPLQTCLPLFSHQKNQKRPSWPFPRVSLTGERIVPTDHSQQPAADDVPRPSALVLHFSDIFLHEPAEDTAAASSSSPAKLRGNTCPGVWALSVQWQVSKSLYIITIILVLVKIKVMLRITLVWHRNIHFVAYLVLHQTRLSVRSDTSLPSTCLSLVASAQRSGQCTRTGTPSWWSSLDTRWS